MVKNILYKMHIYFYLIIIDKASNSWDYNFTFIWLYIIKTDYSEF